MGDMQGACSWCTDVYLSHIWSSHVGRQGPLGTCPLLAPVRLLAALLVGCWRSRAKGNRAPKHGMSLTPARHPPPLPRPRQHWVFAGPLTSASGLPCWSVTDAAGGLEDAVACCNPSQAVAVAECSGTSCCNGGPAVATALRRPILAMRAVGSQTPECI